MERIENKMIEIIEKILDKSVVEITKDEFDILSSEWNRLKRKKDAVEHSKKMTELLANTWTY